MTVNRYCGSGLSAASIVANRIAAGEATIAVAGGVESISLTQMHINLNGFVYAPLQMRMPAVWWTMNQTADFVAKKYGISREAQDEYVVRSQERVAAAAKAGVYRDEIVPFTTVMKVTDKATQTSRDVEVTLDRDEGPRPDTTLAALAKLPPVYPGGTTTAGNASQLSDGAAAVVLMDADLASRRRLPILGLFRGMQLAAVAARGDEHRDRARDPEAPETPRARACPTSISGSCTRRTRSPRSTTRRSSRRRGRSRT